MSKPGNYHLIRVADARFQYVVDTKATLSFLQFVIQMLRCRHSGAQTLGYLAESNKRLRRLSSENILAELR